MATQILALHWKSARLLLLPFVVLAFAVPLLSVQEMGAGWAGELPSLVASRAIGLLGSWGVVYPVLAAAVGSVLALTAWSWDHRGEHVYALSLPVARWRYATLKMGAGALLTLLPAAALLVGALAATAAVEIPEGLRAYPAELATRFLMSTLLVYSLLFALASGTIRTTVAVLTVAVGGVFAADLVVDALAATRPGMEGMDVMIEVGNAMIHPWSPFRILAGNWMLVDV